MTELVPNAQQYKIQFRCPNCGDVFTKLLQKGVEAQGRAGRCPNCGVSDGQPKIGHFLVIKNHPEMDGPERPYYSSPRM